MQSAVIEPLFWIREPAMVFSIACFQKSASRRMHPLVARRLMAVEHRRALQLQLVSLAGLDNPEILKKHLPPVLAAVYSLQEE